MGQWNSVVTSTEKVHDRGQSFNSTVEHPVSTLNTEVRGNLRFFLGSFKKLLKFFYFIIFVLAIENLWKDTFCFDGIDKLWKRRALKVLWFEIILSWILCKNTYNKGTENIIIIFEKLDYLKNKLACRLCLNYIQISNLWEKFVIVYIFLMGLRK